MFWKLENTEVDNCRLFFPLKLNLHLCIRMASRYHLWEIDNNWSVIISYDEVEFVKVTVDNSTASKTNNEIHQFVIQLLHIRNFMDLIPTTKAKYPLIKCHNSILHLLLFTLKKGPKLWLMWTCQSAVFAQEPVAMIFYPPLNLK